MIAPRERIVSIEKKLQKFLKQPGAMPMTSHEHRFILDMRTAASNGVGYGWMQQIIEWEWQEKAPGMSFGPEYYETTIRNLEDQIQTRTNGDKENT